MGTDKAHARLAGIPLLRRVLGAIPRGVPVVLVGPPPSMALDRDVVVTREDPPGGGPAAGLAAGLVLVSTPVVVVLATDLPFLGGLPASLVEELAAGDLDAVLAVDAEGREQPLCAAYRADALRAAITAVGDPDGAAVRRLLPHLRTKGLRPAAQNMDPATDVDTPDDLARAQGALMMQEWIDAVRLDLGTTDEVDVDLVLDVAKDVAHNVARPAAPVTTYLIGLAVGSGMPVAEAAAKVRELASGWIAE